MINRIIGHRGAGILAPENTLIALKIAHDLGLTHVEFDVRLTKDNIAVISHDDSLVRCAHIDQLISNSNYADIKDINMAQHYALDNLHATMPTLKEYLTEAKNLSLHCQVEMKPNYDNADILVKIVQETMDEFYKNTPDESLPLVTSFIPECLKALKDISHSPYKTGVLVKVEETINWQNLAERSKCDFVHLHALYLKEDIAKDIINFGCKINGFHINHPDLAKKAIEFGCQKFTCDIPDIFVI